MTVRNRYLFSQAYLDQVMADPSYDDAATTLAQGLTDWAAFRDDESLSTLIDSWVGPLLDILGFHHQGVEGQPGLERLYSDFTGQELLGLCLTVPPGAEIDSTIKGVHYAFQIIAALQEKGCTWGVLTDGSLWRLVKADVLRPYETYLEVDLDQMGTRPPAETLRVFHTFFRRDAFPADDEGKTALDAHLSCSEEVAKAIQKHLKDKMESVLGALCRGFVMADGRQSYTEEQRAEIFDNATYLVYRILFVLYAEARGLLPLGNPAYDEIGMQRLVGQAVRYHREGVPDPASTTLWDGLRGLSKAIYESDEARGVPAYNGGLFSDEDTDDFSKGYLRDCFISDPHLASALFDLTRIPNGDASDGYDSIDYRDLSVRALGGLYEGMLEYKLFLAEQKTYGIPDRKGGFQYKPATQVERPKRTYREIEAGDVYFAHSPTQRKATGSYYTPEYIVDYNVKQTVERGLRERREPLEAKLARWLGEVASALNDAERTRLQKAVDRELLHFVEREVPTFRVCDPAMGSGHFLVNAAHTIANFIVETLNLAPWESAELDGDPTIWRRRLVESCIFGVDLNPLAVELAKLSLWLHTAAEAKPLNFLDHHLKVGNSLIGAWAEDLGSLPVKRKRVRLTEREEISALQMNLLEQELNEKLPVMLGKVLEISRSPTETPGDIKGKEDADQAIKELKAPFKAVADLWVSTYFGNDVGAADYDEALQHIGAPKELMVLPAVDRARQIAEEKRFFHWELEFPEVFCSDPKERGSAGFDAVVGNPPHGAKLDDSSKTLLRSVLTTASGPFDSAAVFFEQSNRLGRSVFFVMPKPLTFSQKWGTFRDWLSRRELVQCLDVSKAFPDVLHEQVILQAKEGKRQDSYTGGSAVNATLRPIPEIPRELSLEVDVLLANLTHDEIEVGQKIAALPCMDFLSVFRGLPRSRSAKKGIPCLVGGDIDRYWHREPKFRIDHQMLRAAERKINLMTTRKLVGQRIVAHIMHPVDHIDLRITLDRAGLLTFETVENFVLTRGDYYLAMVLAILNSALINWYAYRFVFNKAIRTMDLDQFYVQKLRMPRIHFTTSTQERLRMVEEGKRLMECTLQRLNTDDARQTFAAFLKSELGRWVSARLDAEPEHSDVIHDLLAYLAKQMIRMHKENHGEAKGFQDWLLGYAALPIDEWRLKTRVKAYWQHGWDELQRALRQNRKAIQKASGRNVEEGSALEAIQGRFNQSVARLEPLLERIASTDRLIDLIVYRLYGLTEEEVAIVEERM